MLWGKPSRRMWIAAILVSALCVAGLAYALVTDWNAEPDRKLSPAQRQATSQSGGFGLGLVIGIGAGVVLGVLIAARRKS